MMSSHSFMVMDNRDLTIYQKQLFSLNRINGMYGFRICNNRVFRLHLAHSLCGMYEILYVEEVDVEQKDHGVDGSYPISRL